MSPVSRAITAAARAPEVVGHAADKVVASICLSVNGRTERRDRKITPIGLPILFGLLHRYARIYFPGRTRWPSVFLPPCCKVVGD
jgi:hypothetical protein